MQLTEEQREFFTAMEDLFNAPGWELLSRGWKEDKENLYQHAFFNAKEFDDVRAARVRFGLLNELVELPETIARQKDEILNLESSDDE